MGNSSTTSSTPASAAGATTSTTSASFVGWSSVVLVLSLLRVVVVDCPRAPGLRRFLPGLHGLEAGNVLLARLRRHPGIGRRTMHGGVRHRRVRGSGGPLSAAPAVGRLSRAEIHDSAERIAQHARNRFRYRETPEGAHAGVQRSNEQPQERRKKRGAASTCIGGVLMDAIKTTPREGISSASGQEARNGEGILREDA